MRSVASYRLVILGAGGNASPSAKDIRKVLNSVGIEADDEQLSKVSCELNGKNIRDVIAQGLASWPVCLQAGRWPCLLPGLTAPAIRLASAAVEEKEEKKEKSLESADDLGFGLFD